MKGQTQNYMTDLTLSRPWNTWKAYALSQASSTIYSPWKNKQKIDGTPAIFLLVWEHVLTSNQPETNISLTFQVSHGLEREPVQNSVYGVNDSKLSYKEFCTDF
jgi:hypothetical protein